MYILYSADSFPKVPKCLKQDILKYKAKKMLNSQTGETY